MQTWHSTYGTLPVAYEQNDATVPPSKVTPQIKDINKSLIKCSSVRKEVKQHQELHLLHAKPSRGGSNEEFSLSKYLLVKVSW